MCRLLYTFLMVALIGSTAWAASGFQSSERKEMSSGAGIVLIAALQRGAAT